MVSFHVKGMLKASLLKNRRRTVYRMLAKKHGGIVPCFVCHSHVEERDASVEHVLPRSKGGTDDMNNLSISHRRCNTLRGNA